MMNVYLNFSGSSELIFDSMTNPLVGEKVDDISWKPGFRDGLKISVPPIARYFSFAAELYLTIWSTA